MFDLMTGRSADCSGVSRRDFLRGMTAAGVATLAAAAPRPLHAEEPFVHPHLTGREFLHFVADLYRMPRGAQREERMARLLSLFDLAAKDGDLIGSYSHGMRQKIGLASLLIRRSALRARGRRGARA